MLRYGSISRDSGYMSQNAYPAFNKNSLPRHAANVGSAPMTTNSFRENKNPHAVALGHMTSKAKAEAAAKNGAKGGRPEGS